MGHSRRAWFWAPRAPRFDCRPGGYVGLGSIIKDPFRPDEPINCQRPDALPNDIHVEKSERTNWQELRENAVEGKIGVWARFLGLFRADMGANWMDELGEIFEFERLGTEYFVPPPDFVKSHMESGLVQEHINARKSAPDVYMITAIMTAYGASLNQTKAQGGGFQFEMGADFTSAGAPGVTVGPKAELSARTKGGASGKANDFIFAYRLSRVRYTRGIPQATAYEPRHGTAFDHEGETQERPKNVLNLASVRLDDRDVTSDHLEWEKVVTGVDDFDGEHCECICPE